MGAFPENKSEREWGFDADVREKEQENVYCKTSSECNVHTLKIARDFAIGEREKEREKKNATRQDDVGNEQEIVGKSSEKREAVRVQFI